MDALTQVMLALREQRKVGHSLVEPSAEIKAVCEVMTKMLKRIDSLEYAQPYRAKRIIDPEPDRRSEIA